MATGEVFGPEFATQSETGQPNSDASWSDEAISLENDLVQVGPDQFASVPPSSSGEPPVQTEPAPQQVQQQPVQQPPEQQPLPQIPAQPQPEATPGGAPQGEPPQATSEGFLNGKYKSAEEFETGFNNLRRLQVRTAEQLGERDRVIAQQQEQMRLLLERVRPFLEQPQPQVSEIDPTQLSSEQLQQLIQQEAQRQAVAQIGPQMEQVREEAAQSQAQQQVQLTVNTWLSSHPEIVGTELDYGVNNVMNEFQKDSQGNVRPELFPYTLENMDAALEVAQDERLLNTLVELDLIPEKESISLAREAMQNPALYKQFKANPTYLDSPEGIELAREMAQLPGLYANAQQAAALPSPEAARLAATVETGGSGAPMPTAPGQQPPPPDEMDESIALWGHQSANVFGLDVPADILSG